MKAQDLGLWPKWVESQVAELEGKRMRVSRKNLSEQHPGESL